MTGSGMEFQRAGDLLAQARQLRDALAEGKPIDPHLAEHTSAVLSDLIEMAASLLAERQAYESRLHRSPARGVFTTELDANPQ
jgi:hypothetical protein